MQPIVIGWKDSLDTPTYEDLLAEKLYEQEARINAAIFLSAEAAKRVAMQVVWDWEITDDEVDD